MNFSKGRWYFKIIDALLLGSCLLCTFSISKGAGYKHILISKTCRRLLYFIEVI